MAYTLSKKACEKISNEKVVQFPSQEMIDQNATNVELDILSLVSILTAPNTGCYFNFVLNSGDKTNQRGTTATTKENKIPQDKKIHKVVIYYYRNFYIERFEFFDKYGNSFFQAGR